MVRHGRVAEAVLHEAEEIGADMIAMSTHGFGALRKLVRGSNTTEVLHSARVPVLLVRAERIDLSQP
jgi:nucleotide-binding universal stress UspA family protein